MKPAAFLFAALLSLSGGAAAAVDANRAYESALMGVSGIGPAIAARIVAARREGGPFRDLDDLRERVRGVGEANVRKMAAAGLAVGAAGGAPAGPGAAGASGAAGAGQGAAALPGAGCGPADVELIVGNGRLPAAPPPASPAVPQAAARRAAHAASRR